VKHHRALRRTIADHLHALIPDGTGLVVPTTPGPAPAKSASAEEISSFYRSALPLNAIAGHAGLPQVTIPVAQLRGCPLGLSIVGAPGSDHALLHFAAKLTDSFADRSIHV
jgi:amidase